jgi:hypothetical protein
MTFRLANLKWWLPVAGAVAVSFAQAQTLMRPGQSIIFSAPADGDAAANAPSPAGLPPAAPGFGDTIHAPDFNFQTPAATSAQPPNPMPATVSPAEADRRENWALMTPAEILGVATPEQVLQIPQRDAAGQRKNPTAVERYYERQSEMQTNGNAGFFTGKPFSRGIFQDNENSRLNANVFNPSDAGFGNPAQSADPFQKPPPGIGAAADPDADSDWPKIFISPPTPVQTPAQEADMAEFRKLLEPSQPSSTAVKSSIPSSGDSFFPSPQTPPISTFGQPMNPVGTPFGQINNEIGGLPALPGVVGQSTVPTVMAAPDWKPQLPPWMLKGPQPGVIPKRQF